MQYETTEVKVFEAPDGDRTDAWRQGFFVDHRTIGVETLYTDIYHCHTYFELELITEGFGVHHINNQQIDAKRGYIALIRKSDFHTYHINSNSNLSLYCTAFKETNISSEILKQVIDRRGSIDCFLSEDDFEKMKVCFEIMLKAYNNDERNLNVICKSCLNILISTILKNLPEDEPEDDINGYLKEAIVYIEQHFSDVNLSLSQVASAVGIGQNYLGQIFSKELHVTYTDYIRNKRLSHAIELLKQKRMSNDKIAKLCGFSSGAYFISVFKKQYGMTPKKYIEGYKKF